MFYRILLSLIIIFFASASVPAETKKHKESEYQKKWCSAMCGTQEYRLEDKTRVDCLTSTHAIEFDFAHKIYESIGQSLYYSIKTNKKPGIVLIIEQPIKEEKYIMRMKQIAASQGIDCWLMYESDLSNFHIHPVKL